MVGKQYGWVKIISTAIQRRGAFIHWDVQCTGCGTRTMQVSNRRNTVKVLWGGELVPLREFPSPYAPGYTYRMVKVQGLSGEEIIEKFMTS